MVGVGAAVTVMSSGWTEGVRVKVEDGSLRLRPGCKVNRGLSAKSISARKRTFTSGRMAKRSSRR